MDYTSVSLNRDWFLLPDPEDIHYKETKPFANTIGIINKITYSSGSHEREIELKEKDIVDIRDSCSGTRN